MTSRLMDEPVEVLSIGSIGGVSPNANAWRRALREVAHAVARERSGAASNLNVNVIFHIHTRDSPNEFAGVRTGSYSKKHNLLAVQVALPEMPPENAAQYLWSEFAKAIDVAERWARRRNIAGDLESLKRVARNGLRGVPDGEVGDQTH